MGGSPGAKENSAVESSAKTHKLLANFCAENISVTVCEKSREQKRGNAPRTANTLIGEILEKPRCLNLISTTLICFLFV